MIMPWLRPEPDANTGGDALARAVLTTDASTAGTIEPASIGDRSRHRHRLAERRS